LRHRNLAAIGLRLYRRLHLEEGNQVGEEERLVGDAGDGRKDLLQVGAGLLNRRGEEGELTDVVVAAERAPDDIDIGAVITERSDDAEHAAHDQLRTRERDILDVDLVSQRLELAGEELVQAEELDLFGSLAAAGDLAEVVHLPLGRGLAKVLGVAQESEVRLPQK
jgi:hypothetical protein